jgi:hypothetical protein
MKTGTFMDWVASNYKEIKQLFKTRTYNMNYEFDEDSFNDAFIKCVNKFESEKITYETVLKYFWTSYINTVKTNLIKESNMQYEELDEELHDCIDNTYNEFFDDDYSKEVYNIIMNAITVKYGKEDAKIYSLYKYHDWTENDLIAAGYDCDNLKKKVAAIHRFVKAYSKKYINN